MTATQPALIPPADPRAAYLAQQDAIDAAIRRVLDSGRYILGHEVEAFEREFAAWLGAGHAIGVANGTDAVELAVRSVGVGPGDEVIAPAHTATATIAAIERAGAVPVLVDIEPVSYGLDPAKLAQTVHRHRRHDRLKAMVVAHLYGHPAAMDEIVAIASASGLALVEDCAQAHGAKWKGRCVGTIGDVGAFSFYPTKNLGALGDGGAVVTSNEAIAGRVRLLRQYGWRERYRSEIPGGNSRLDEIQAAVLRVKLQRLADDNARRRAIARTLDAAVVATGRTGPAVQPGAEHVYHQYVIRHEQRDVVATRLRERGVGSAVLYPLPIHAQPAYAGRLVHGEGGLAVSEQVCRELLCLPVYPQLDVDQVARVAGAVGSCLLGPEIHS